MNRRGLRSAVLAAASLVAACATTATAPPPCTPSTPPVVAPSEPTAAAAPGPPTAPPSSTTEPTLVLDGIPPLDPALRAQAARWLETRAAAACDVSDDGTRVLVLTRFAQTAQLHLVRRPLGARTQLTFRAEPVVDARFVPGAPDSVVYTSDVGGTEQYQLYRLDIATQTTTRLTDGASRHETFVFSRDGTQLAFNGTGRNGRDLDIYLSDGRTATGRRLALERSGNWAPVEFSRDGTKLLLSEYVSINDIRLHLWDTRTGEVRRLSPESPVAAYRQASFGATDERVYVSSDREGEFVELYELDLRNGAFRSLTRTIPWNVDDFALAPDGRTLVIATNEEGWSALRTVDARTGAQRRVEAVARAYVSGLRFASNAPVVAFTSTGATQTPDAYTFSLRDRRVARWTESELGGLTSSMFVEPSLIRFRSFDEREIPAFLFAPSAPRGPVPVLIDIHGGPEAQARPRFDPLTQFLVHELGIAVVQPNVRGSDGYGKSYLRLDNAALREDSVRDIGALLDWIASQPALDARRIAVTGGSYGGYMSLASLVHYGERLRAGIAVVGISNFVTFLENTAEYRRDLRRVEYGDERDPAMRARLIEMSPLTHAQRIRSALFVAQGQNDPRVPAGEAEQIVDAVRANGRDVWYMLARNEGHGFRRKENRDAYRELSIAFLAAHLVGDASERVEHDGAAH